MNAFETALDANPADWDLRQVYADWLEERGDTKLATAQRWMAENEKRPFCSETESPHWSKWERDNCCCLGMPTFSAEVEERGGVFYFPTRIAAEAALADALERLEVTHAQS